MGSEATRDLDRAPTHPGELLSAVVLPATGKTKTEIARLLGISLQTLSEVLSERAPVTADIAVRLGKLIGNGPALWMNMQSAHDLWQAERRIDTSAIPTLDAA